MEQHAQPTQIEFREVAKSYGSVAAVRHASLTVGKGELVTILGPSGSGKTTTLMLLAGFETPDSGDILVAGHQVAAVPPFRRDQGIVFQNYALFPHMTVRQNLAFPLEMRGVSRAERQEKVVQFLDRVRLTEYGDRFPNQLSGGQQQRVALARALIADPPVLLLDEPLGALDRNLREQMQREIKALHREFGMTTICVTHDQEEALTLSDRVVVMEAGRIVQVDTPETLYDRPANTFVARFLGDANILDGTGIVPETTVESGSVAMIRPERIGLSALDAGRPADAGQRQIVDAEVVSMIYAGPTRKYIVQANGYELLVRETVAADQPVFAPGARVWAHWRRADLRIVRM